MARKRDNSPEAILSTDTGQRLDAIVRRHGGKPSSTDPINGRVVLPAPKRGHRKGQLALDDVAPRMSVTVSREQGYWRAKCVDKDTCALRTAAGNVGAYWRGGHQSSARDAHADAIVHLADRHDVMCVCGTDGCAAPAIGVVQRRGETQLRCAVHHVDLRGVR